MKRRAIVIGMAWLLYAVSWFLPVHEYGTTLSKGGLPGWDAFRVALTADYVSRFWGFLGVSSALTNFVMIASPVILLSRFDRLKRALAWLLILGTVLNMHWFILHEDRANLRAGYYLWCGSFFILAVGCLLNLRARRAARAARYNASGTTATNGLDRGLRNFRVFVVKEIPFGWTR